MAEFQHRIPQNVPGKFYVDDQCIYCNLCREMLPMVFREEPEYWASVFHQPSTAEEIRIAMEAVECCPVEAIGCDGDVHDWSMPPTRTEAPVPEKRVAPWWKFWALAKRVT